MKTHRYFLLLILPCFFLASPACSRAIEPGEDESARIAQVEQGLIPRLYYEEQEGGVSLAERMRLYNVPGISIAVIEDGEVAWAKGYGIGAGPEGTDPINAETLFQAASISKPIAVMAVLRLVEQGQLDLDEGVNHKLKSWKVPANEWTRQSPVTLRTLMSHTAGTTVHGFPGYSKEAPLPQLVQVLDGESPANTDAVRVDKLPGEGFRYSGGGTTIMQQLALDTSGLPFPEFMSQQILEPLDMRRSTYQQPLASPWTDNASLAHDGEGQAVEGGWHTYPEMAAAGLWTTPSDLAKAVLEVQKSLAGKSNLVLEQTTVEEMLTPQNGGPVGLGFFLAGEGSEQRFGHGGSNRGFRCQVVAYLHRGQGAAVMTNASRGGALAQEVLEAIARVYQWPGFPQESVKLVRLQPQALDGYTGTYRVGSPVGRFEIVRQGDRLIGRREGSEEINVLLPVSETEFVIEMQGSRVQFELEEGRAVAFTIRLGGQDRRAERVEE